MTTSPAWCTLTRNGLAAGTISRLARAVNVAILESALPAPPEPKPKRSWRMKGEASDIVVRKVEPSPVSDEERLANEIEYVNRGLGLPLEWKP